MARVTKRNNKWSARITYYDENGVRRSKNKQGFDTKREADYWVSKNEVRKFEDGTLFESKQPLTEFFSEWYLRYKKDSIQPATQKWYENVSRLLTEYFDQTAISAISKADYQDFMNELGKDRVRSSLSKMNNMIRQSVQVALDTNLIRKDFTRGVVFNTTNLSKSADLKFLNADETENLVKAALDGATTNSMARYMIVAALYTGARLSELAGLTWSDIDYDFKTIRINKTYDYLHVGSFKETKNMQSHRVVKVNDEMLSIFRSMHRQQTMVFPRLGIKNEQHFVFKNSQDSVPTSNGVNKTLRRLLKQIKVRKEVEELNFHSLRHTHASYLLYKGVSIYYISSRLGHANIATTMSVYSHILKELEKEETEKTLTALSNL